MSTFETMKYYCPICHFGSHYAYVQDICPECGEKLLEREDVDIVDALFLELGNEHARLMSAQVENARIKERNEVVEGAWTTANAYREAFQAENARLRAALAQYADPSNWGCQEKLGSMFEDCLWLDADAGPYIAVKALEGGVK